MSLKSYITFYMLIACTAALGGCSTTMSGRNDLARSITQPANLQEISITAAPFVLTGWQRQTISGEPVHIYIEGDGLAWLGRGRPSPNPTPRTPVALKLAAQDNGPNVTYLARPCQYTPPDLQGNNACRDAAHWTGKRYSKEIVDSYMTALDDIAARTNAGGFHIIGFSGGANIAGLLAARRSDVLSIRTVAGNIDNVHFTRLHKVSAMPQSLNMADNAHALRHIPQIHFIGGEDKIVPVDLYKSYSAKAGASACIQHRIIPDASHDRGWEDAWPRLLAIHPACEANQ